MSSAEECFDRGMKKWSQESQKAAIAAITDYDGAIKFKSDYAEAWYNRGVAKQEQGDTPGAIADYDEAIKLKPDLAEAWYSRCIAKQIQGNFQDAITDYNEGVKLEPGLTAAWHNRDIVERSQGAIVTALDYDEIDSAEAWYNHGLAKRLQGDFQGAIADLDKAINLKHDYAEAWYNRGLAKQDQGERQGAIAAIADLDEAINLKPDYVEALCNRGAARQFQGNFQGAIADYDEVTKLEPDLADAWINRSFIKDAVNLEEIREIRKIFVKAYSAIEGLRKKLDDKEEDRSKHPMHYTNLDTLLNLAKGEKFRLYNAKSMDDSEEGNAIFDLFDLFDEEHQAQIRNIFSATEDLEVFIGSFVTDNNINYGDDLIWRTYGKHKGEERAGCALVFNKEHHFPSKPPQLLESLLWTQLLEAWSKDFTDKEQATIVPTQECYLYPVSYSTKIQAEVVNNLYKVLVQLCDKKCEETCKIVTVLLNHVRYLFKYDIYQREKEYRLAIVRARKSPAVNRKNDPPRAYVECSLDMKKVTVLLGPEVKKAETWKQWLEDEGSFKEINLPAGIPKS